jgi:alpha-L-fucosidase 2
MSEFVFPGELATVDYPGFLSQHDVVYLGPVPYGIDGLPIGNGDLGAVVWTPPDHLRLSVNKKDLWDDGPDGPFSAWGDEDEEVSTMLRSACSISVDHGLPSFDRLYLTAFEGRLRLAEAQVDFRAKTPFSAVRSEVLVSEGAGVLVVRYWDETEEPLPRRFEVARWGTRSLLHWYRKIRRVVPLSLTGTQAGVDGEHVWIEQRLRDLRFAVAARMDGAVHPRRLHRRAGVFESDPVEGFEGALYVAVVTSEEADDPLAAALRRVDAAAQQGVDTVVQEHRGAWRRFWEASFVDLPPEQDYIENLWYLNNYHMGSASKGRYPLNHMHAVWAWNRDVFPWMHYYHWNEQMHVYSLHAVGHPELALAHFRWRRSMLEHAVEDARRIHGIDGAFYSDVANRRGYQAAEPGEGLGLNLTPGPQIAAQFWQHYQYTRDRDFLAAQAYPVIREVARFYLGMVKRQADGSYTFIGTQPYEGSVLLKDTLTDLAHARQLLKNFSEAGELLGTDEALRTRAREVLENLADYVVLPVSTESWVDPDSIADLRPILFKAVGPGDPTVPIWFVGYKMSGGHAGEHVPDGTPIHEGMADPARGFWVFTSTTMAPIFPSNNVGLDQAGTAEFDVAVNTVKSLGYDHQGFSLWIVAKARLGLAEALSESLRVWPERFQIFPQGFSHWALSDHPDMEEDPRYLKEIEVVGSPGETVHWPIAAVSLHMSIEALPVLQLAVNEMLLQSYSGTIRVFPAVTDDWEGRFRLHAVGRFVVSAAREKGVTGHVVIESRGGEPCRMANPWPGQMVSLYRKENAWTPIAALDGEVWTFPTEPSGVYLLLPEDVAPGTLAPVHITAQANQGPKEYGNARLGIPQGF